MLHRWFLAVLGWLLPTRPICLVSSGHLRRYDLATTTVRKCASVVDVCAPRGFVPSCPTDYVQCLLQQQRLLRLRRLPVYLCQSCATLTFDTDGEESASFSSVIRTKTHRTVFACANSRGHHSHVVRCPPLSLGYNAPPFLLNRATSSFTAV